MRDGQIPGGKGARKETSACWPVLPPKDGDEEKALPPPQGLQGVCNDALPLGLNIFQQPVSSTSF